MFKRCFTLIICFIITLCNIFFFVAKAKEDNPVLYNLSIISNEINEKSIIVYIYDNDIFISINDICRLTRSTCEISDSEIRISHGIMEIQIDIEGNKITFWNQSTDFETKQYNGQILVKPYAILELLCARCSFIEDDNTLCVFMPSLTSYEAVDFNLYNKCHYYMYEGDEFNTIVRMTVAAFSDLAFDGIGNFFNKLPDILSFNGSNSYIDNALIEISKVKIDEYQAVKIQINETSEKRNAIFSCVEKASSYTESAVNLSSSYTEILKKTIGNSDLSISLLRESLSKLTNIADVLSIVKSAEEKLNYDMDSFELIGKIMTKDNIGSIEGTDYIIERADYISEILESRLIDYLETTSEKAKEKILENVIEELAKKLDTGSSLSIGDVCQFIMAFEIGTNVTKILMNDEFQAWDSDMNAIVLSEIQNTMFKVIQKKYINAFTNYDNTIKFIDCINLYNRITIAMYSNLKKSNEEFNIYDDSFSGMWDSLCEESAVNSYNLYTCNPKEDICSIEDFQYYYNKHIIKTNQIEETTEFTLSIPKEASTYNGHAYMVYPESMTWQEAKEYCEKLGGHLVTISDADEQKFVEDLAEKCTDKVSYWLGGYYSDAEWKWVDDTEFSYTNWDSWTDGEKEYRQPDNFTGDEFYLRFANRKMKYENWYSNKGKWNDIANAADGTSGDVPLDSFGVICEWDNISQDNATETEATANIVDSGTCGDNLTWTLDTNGQLTIEGKGEMYNYYTPYNKSADSPPWRSQKIKSVIIKSGVTSIGNGAFGWQDNLESISIADTVTSIGIYSFFSCDRLGYLFQIPESITSIGKGAFDLCCNTRLIYVGKNVTKLDDYSLDPEYLIKIYGYEGSEAQAYAGRNGISFVCVDDDYGYHGTISNQNGASFRSGSSEKSKEISVIPYGTELSEYDSIGDWALIKYKGTLGYVYKDDLLFEGGFAKPVIYLYPEKKQDVSVKVNFKKGDFTCTYPEYNNGWNVTAYPNGRIINKSDNDEYSYLYWEGEGAIQYDFSSGFVVKREDIAEFLKEKLSYMGLSPKEYNEFIVYWLPIMQKNEYNLISFQMENYKESAQLEVLPKPDSMLRVFMAFQEADVDTKVPEQQLNPFQRKGFTVVEWGGTEVQ